MYNREVAQKAAAAEIEAQTASASDGVDDEADEKKVDPALTSIAILDVPAK